MLTQRLGLKTQLNAAFINELLDGIKRHPGCCDEIWLATEYGFPPPAAHESTARALSKTAALFRGAGLRVSLQISNTIGHGEYMKFMDCTGLVYEGSPAEKMVGPDGAEAGYCFCWNGGHFRKYTAGYIGLYAKLLQPHTVWFDDDLRAGNHAPVNYGCFCGGCIEKFNKLHNAGFTRETLAHEINYGALEWRQKYVDFVRDNLREFTELIAGAVMDASPDSCLGYQHGSPGGYTGYGLEYIFGALQKAGGKQVKSRPGGGSYNDHNPNDLITKSFYISWQNRMLPAYVKERRPEIENLPYVAYGKTAGGTCLETALYLASGNTAMSYAMLMFGHEPMEWHEKALAKFAFYRPYWERLAERSADTRQAGLQLALGKCMWEKPLSERDGAFAWAYEPVFSGTNLARAGIPLSFDEAPDPVYLLHEDAAALLGDDEIGVLLASPVVTSAAAMAALISRGCSFGAGAEHIPTRQLYEVYTGHPINGGSAGREWDQSFSCPAGYYLTDTDGKTEVFGRYASNAPNADYTGAAANAVVYTGAGAKWAVFGHTLWNTVMSRDKRDQILRAADYISGRRLPAFIETPQQAILLPRENKNGRTVSVSVLNCTVEETEGLDLAIRRPAGTRAIWISQKCPSEETVLPVTERENEWLLRLPALGAWEIGTVFID